MRKRQACWRANGRGEYAATNVSLSLPDPAELIDLQDLPTSPPQWSDLRPAPTVLPQMAAIRAHIAGNSPGITRDDSMIRELVKILHAKTWDERQLLQGKRGRFYFLQGESCAAVRARIERLLATTQHCIHQGGRPASPWGERPELLLDEASVAFAVGKLQGLAMLSAERDVVGEAFESLIGPSLRGAEGQFFTPRNLVQMCVEMLDPREDERVIDPACGAGGFLGEALRRRGRMPGQSRRQGVVVGIDKDAFLAALCGDHLGLHPSPHAVFCANSLQPPATWPPRLQEIAPLGSFDVLLTNPPFGVAIPVKGSALLGQYELARKWKRDRGSGSCRRTDHLMEARPPQVLFVERSLQFLRPGGRAALVLPEGIFGNKSEGYLRSWVTRQADLLAVVDCPPETFLPSTPTKTCVLFLQKKDPRNPPPEDARIFLAIAEHCGHDRRGRPLYRQDGSRLDDFPAVARDFRAGPGGGS